ncbi:hypothetical protein AC423_002575 [Salmonella enterica subsp. enterica]|nr:hypothetical protein [Salmonella enterica subsp. enterica]
MDKIIGEDECYYIVTGDKKLRVKSESDSPDEFDMVCNILVQNISDGFCTSFHIPNQKIHEPSFYDVFKIGEFLYLTLGVAINHFEWAQPFKMREFYDEFSSQSKLFGINSEVKINEGEGCDYIDFTLKLSRGCISEFIDEFVKNSSSFILKILNDMLHSASDSIFSRVFSFPGSYKFICCQYLMWFGEFLSGLGIQAEVSTKDEGGGYIVFSTALENNKNLMSKVESLFYEYICLPYCEYLPSNDSSASVEERLVRNTLLAQVEHFKSQILLKESIIEVKNIAIDMLKGEVRSLEESNEDKKILIDSLSNSNEISILNGAVKFGDIKKFGITFSPKKFGGLFKK